MDNYRLRDIYSESGFHFFDSKNFTCLKKGVINYSFPTVDDAVVSSEDLKILKKKCIFCLVKIEHPVKNCNEYIFKGSDYNLECFHSKTRNQIRKGLKECTIRRPTLKELIEYGLEINVDTLKRHHQKESFLENSNKWQNYISPFYNNEEVIIMAAFVEEKMIGYLLALKTEHKYYLLHPFFNKAYSSFCPMNALLFTLINQIIIQEQSVSVSYGIESFEPNGGLDKFKTSMLFKKEKVTRALFIHPFVKFIMKFFISALGGLFGKWVFKKNEILKKLIYTFNSNKLLYNKLSN